MQKETPGPSVKEGFRFFENCAAHNFGFLVFHINMFKYYNFVHFTFVFFYGKTFFLKIQNGGII
jgi:hypothetical protein